VGHCGHSRGSLWIKSNIVHHWLAWRLFKNWQEIQHRASDALRPYGLHGGCLWMPNQRVMHLAWEQCAQHDLPAGRRLRLPDLLPHCVACDELHHTASIGLRCSSAALCYLQGPALRTWSSYCTVKNKVTCSGERKTPDEVHAWAAGVGCTACQLPSRPHSSWQHAAGAPRFMHPLLKGRGECHTLDTFLVFWPSLWETLTCSGWCALAALASGTCT